MTAVTAQDAVGLLKDAGYIRNRDVGKSNWWEPNLTRCAVG